jgi:ribose-phosphate pyrophosphokinase
MVVMEKKRFLDRHDESEAFQIIGDIRGKSAVIVDDVMSSGGTIINGAVSLKKAGVKSVTVLVTHAVCAGDAFERLAKAPIDHLIMTDTINWTGRKMPSSIKILSVASEIAGAISTIIG